LGPGFYGSIAKQSLLKQWKKIIEKFIVSFIVTVISLFFTVRQLGGGGDRTIAPSLNTPLDIAPPGQFPLLFYTV